MSDSDTTEFTDFNPHSHAGSDWCLILTPQNLRISIHTPTQGVTHTYVWVFKIQNFNPHSHAGSDQTKNIYRESNKNFNPHSHAGSDVTMLNPYYKSMDFNPHSHAGSDYWQSNHNIKALHFNPHSHAGSDKALRKSVVGV